MHSVAFCLSHIPDYFGANVDMLSKKLKNETLMNAKLNGDYIDGGIQALRNGVTDYLCHKLYDTSYGDIIPNIMSNAIMTNLLLIIEHEGSHSLQLIKCIDEYRHMLLLYKRGEHYLFDCDAGRHADCDAGRSGRHADCDAGRPAECDADCEAGRSADSEAVRHADCDAGRHADCDSGRHADCDSGRHTDCDSGRPADCDTCAWQLVNGCQETEASVEGG